MLGRSSGDYARRRVRDEVAEIKAGQRERISVSNQLEMTEFVAAARELDDSHPFELSIEYASKVDDFLRQIASHAAGCGLVLNLTDVSDAGIESVAAIPDLERLTINYIGEGLGSSGGWLRYLPPQTLVETLEPLEKSPKLARLELYTARRAGRGDQGAALPAAELHDQLAARRETAPGGAGRK